MGAMKQVGRIGLRALIYFEFTTVLALAIGLVIVDVMQPGRGIGFDPSSADLSAVAAYTGAAQQSQGTVDFLLNIIPDTIVGAFARGDVLQVLVFAVLFGLALLKMGPLAAPLVEPDLGGVGRALRDRRDDHAARADRRVRRDGVHGRAVRRRHRSSRWAS